MAITARAEEDSALPMRRLRAGEWVEVLSKAEILATLDERGQLENLPFMPEMFRYCGKRFRVFKRAHKTCDTVNKTGGRRMENAVHLDGARCDGGGHGGCEAACLIFWKDAWLRRVDGPSDLVELRRPPDRFKVEASSPVKCDERSVIESTLAPEPSGSSEPTYVCQATRLPYATRLLPWWDLRQYVEDCTSRNVSVREMLGSAAYVAYTLIVRLGYRTRLPVGPWLRRIDDLVQRRAGTVPFPEKRGTLQSDQKTPARPPLNLQAGDLVRVRSYEQILSTLNQDNRHRGMAFCSDDAAHCGGSFRVRSRVSKIINEQTGKMIQLKGNNFILEGAWCQSRYTSRRRHCPRAIHTFWREDWLEGAESPQPERTRSHIDPVFEAQTPGR